jgi:hypothetical protein
MARIRRPKKINGSEYTFGGGSGAGGGTVGGLVKIAKGNMNTGNANHDGFLSSGDTVSIKLDAGTAIPVKDQYIYFDNAFETATGTISYEFMNGDTALPAGISFSSNTDSSDTDTGEARFSGTPSTEGTNSFRVKATYPSGSASEQVEIIYTIQRFAVGTTPVWSSSSHKFSRILRNFADDQVLADGPATSYSGASYSLTGVSGFPTGVVPELDPATGSVKVSGIGDVTQDPTPHQYTVVADLGSEIGTFSQTFTGDISYGDPYGSALFSPANARTNYTSGITRSLAETKNELNFQKGTGALRRYHNGSEDTSPYIEADGYGCEWSTNMLGVVTNPQSYANNTTTAYRKNGSLGFQNGSDRIWQSTSNYQTVKFRWTVPNGITQIAVCCIGGGSMGSYSWSSDGGGGAGLAWMNGIAVTPGEEFIVGVGLGRYSESSHGSYGGGPSFFIRASTNNCLLYAQQGGFTNFSTSNPNGQSTSYTGGQTIQGLTYWNRGGGYNYNNSRDGGGYGVRATEGTNVNDGSTNFHYGGGGAGYCNDRHGTGAGGYRGQNVNGNEEHGQYGGGGNSQNYSSTYGQGGGGGTGLDGQGWRGSRYNGRPDQSTQAGSGYGGSNGQNSFPQGSSPYRGAGGGGSGGSRGVYRQNQYNNGENSNQRGGQGGLHGGGGGGSGTSWGGGNGGSGGVKIIWGVAADGTTRCYPYNYTTENPAMKVAGQS